ncbi:type VI secretion system tip protein TssI/VgrG, partial [Shigella sonnei]|uniref:type VI secretion system tip protein TssI/VgrG n=2 Tax=Shigella sonnei TaxID=624 RepID=UPI003BF8D7A6
WQGDDVQRRVKGVVTWFELGENDKNQMLYSMKVCPPLWRTGLRQNFRIFQNEDIESILATILKENGVTEWSPLFSEPHPSREFCVQYGETDYDFLCRMAAEEGIFFYEEHAQKSTDQSLVLCDTVRYLPESFEIPWNPNTRTEVSTFCISQFRYSAQIRPSSVVTKDYTFKRPGWAGRFDQEGQYQDYQRTQYEVYDYPGRFKGAHGQNFARWQMDGWRNNAEVARGTSRSPEIWPGRRIVLTGHPQANLNREWQVVASELHGEQPQAVPGRSGSGTTLNNHFAVIPADRTWRPQPLLKPLVDGPQSAVVTGPAGEEIFCDEHGRVRVKFNWDRYNPSNQDSSCWIRVAQAWAGTGFGNLAIPRVGQEVIVDFLNGDPDQPIIMGRTYHQENRTPGSLPGTKTQMTIRSKTYKGSGFNELKFDDATGKEQVYIHVQKNMNTEVLNNRTTDVINNHAEKIGNNQAITVTNNQIQNIGVNQIQTVGVNLVQNFRIFQNEDIESILATILKENGVTEWSPLFSEPHPSREFCVQYGETDYDFLCRMAAEEGIFFYEEHAQKSTDQSLVLCDTVRYLPESFEIPWNPNTRTEVSTLCISQFRYSAQIRPSSVVTKDYTFKRPGWPGRFDQEGQYQDYQRTQYEVYDYPGRFKGAHGQNFARWQMDGWRNNAEVARGTSRSPEIWPGRRIVLTGHPQANLNREWQVVASDLHGEQPQAVPGRRGSGTTLENHFAVIPADRTWRPQPLMKPLVDGPQSAVVTGPAGEEIFCDEHGRVRVKFNWDRYNPSNQDSSCWIRVAQAWAGTGFGNLAIPRVGQEVIVDFLNGDPDQPIIMGRTYHQENRTPGSLPGTKTQMTIRSKTYKGSGFNELKFDDATGKEQVYIHAQKNMNTEVLNNRTTDVINNHAETIGNNQ